MEIERIETAVREMVSKVKEVLEKRGLEYSIDLVGTGNYSI
jgi:predicted RNase H-like nuclease (RuvC/YqgF family)